MAKTSIIYTSKTILRKFIATTSAIALVSASLAPAASALPTGGTVTSGVATITNTANTTNINQSSNRTDINWNTFNTEANEAVNFNLPSNSAVSVNHVTGGQASVLKGSLNSYANGVQGGHVVLISDGDITFAAGSQTHVGSLTASNAKNVTTDANGNLIFSNLSNGSITNNGEIIANGNGASGGGFVVIHSSNVTNNGSISADHGQVTLAGTDGVTIDLTGNGKITLQPGAALDQSKITNNGTISAAQGTIVLTNQAANDVANSVINLNGVLDTKCLSCNGNGGTIQVASAGDLNVTGTQIADAGTTMGNGGSITNYAAGALNVTNAAHYSAHGGGASGNGGTITFESAHANVNGSTDVTAPGGNAGTVNLINDSSDVEVKNGNGVNDANTYYEQWIENQSQGGATVNVTGHNITVDDIADNVIQGGAGTINLKTVSSNGSVYADGAITFVDKKDTIATTTGDINMVAGSGGINIGNLIADGGATQTAGHINLQTINGGSITTGNLTVNSPRAADQVGNQLVLNSDRDITVNGKVYIYSNDYIDPAISGDNSIVSATIKAKNNIVLNDDVTLKSFDNVRPNINAQANLDVEAGVGNSNNGLATITTKGLITVAATGNSVENTVSDGYHDVGTTVKLLAKDGITALKDITSTALSTDECIFPINTHSTVDIESANADVNVKNVTSSASAGVPTSNATASLTVFAKNGQIDIGTLSSQTTATNGISNSLVDVEGVGINFNGQDPYSTADAQKYQGRVSGVDTNGTDVARVIIVVQPPVNPPPGGCPTNDCTEQRLPVLVDLPNPSNLSALSPAAGSTGNFCQDVNVAGLPGLCTPDEPQMVELAPAAGPAPVKYVSPFKVGPSLANKKASNFAELSPAAGEKCMKVKGGKDTVCIKDEIDK